MITIKHRYTKEILFSVEADNLVNADLRRANLGGIKLCSTRGNGNEIKSMHVNIFDVAWTKDVLQIGCKQYTIAEWLQFDDATINAMDLQALEFCRKWKPILISILKLDKEEN